MSRDDWWQTLDPSALEDHGHVSWQNSGVSTGQPVGGVGPFGHIRELTLYCDASLRDFDAVYPAAGSRSSAFRITPDELGRLTGAEWVDVCSLPA